MTTRIVTILLIFVLPFLWEIYGAITGDVSLISPQLRYLGKEWNGFLIYIVNVVQGHVWYQPESFTPAEYLTEWTEIAIVVSVGWIIYGAFRTFREAFTPMSNIAVIILAVCSFAVGGFFWNLAA